MTVLLHASAVGLGLGFWAASYAIAGGLPMTAYAGSAKKD
jgi:hypothetical protein